LNFSHQTRVFLFTEPVDMRKSFRGLCQLTESVLKEDPASGHWFAFINRRCDRLKLLGWDGQGFWIWYKQLESGSFEKPTTDAKPVQIAIDELQAVIDTQPATVDTQQATIDEQQAMLESLQHNLALMKRMVFGQRRERFEDPRQGTRFDSVVVGEAIAAGGTDELDALTQDDRANEADGLTDSDSANEAPKPPSTRRGGRGRRVFPACLEREVRLQKLTDEDIPEDLQGTDCRCFQKKVGEWIEYIPPSMKVMMRHVGGRRLHWLRVFGALHARSDSVGRLSCTCASQVRGAACAWSDGSDVDGAGLLPAAVRYRRRVALTMTTRWECFERFLESGAIAFDNNA